MIEFKTEYENNIYDDSIISYLLIIHPTQKLVFNTWWKFNETFNLINTQYIFMIYFPLLNTGQTLKFKSVFLLLLNYYLFVSIIIMLRYSSNFAAKDTGKITTSCVWYFRFVKTTIFLYNIHFFLSNISDMNSILIKKKFYSKFPVFV